jgi:hypothetical protein
LRRLNANLAQVAPARAIETFANARQRVSDTVYDLLYALDMRAVSAAIHVAGGFHTVTYDAVTAMLARGCQGVDGAFERIERVGLAVHRNEECLVVVVAAHFTLGHFAPPIVGVFRKLQAVR